MGTQASVGSAWEVPDVNALLGVELTHVLAVCGVQDVTCQGFLLCVRLHRGFRTGASVKNTAAWG